MTHRHRSAHVIDPRRRTDAETSRIEWRVVDIPRDMPRNDARAMLTEHAEYGRWELARTQLYRGGARRVWLKRRALKVKRTDAA
ncbi:DUF5703 family protein [Demequina pelophila]|uniref:DUF5703 family protein n=1 Tax=Demequina pelophila TaxID=1638984 RepID=UPI000781142E|nr:DUF5703 family protein [Demequina pelophila]